MKPAYIHIPPGSELPTIKVQKPFMAIIIIESSVEASWRDTVSDWLVKSGCLYMMAWGDECALWDDSVDYANLQAFDFGEVPDEKFVTTTWHDDEPLEEVFWFAQHAAHHRAITEKRILLVDISPSSRKESLLKQLKDSNDLHDRNPD